MPPHVRSPLKLVLHVMGSGSAAARFSVISAAMSIALLPIDLILSYFEKMRYEKASKPLKPLVLVCGPPRSGTTLTAQVLIKYLPLSYFSNLTSWFPRAPLVASKLFWRWIPKRDISYTAFYGKTRFLSGPNDALYLWDRWLGKNRDIIPENMLLGAETEIQKFFSSAEALFGTAIINKNNRLNTYAHLVENALPNATFICLRRNPIMLAQSLLIARKEIVGQVDQSYGIDSEDRPRPIDGDYINDICQQVLYYEGAAANEQKLIGKERFWIVDYEDFCRNPRELVKRVAKVVLAVELEEDALSDLTPFQISDRIRISEKEFDALQKTLGQYRPDQIG